MRRVQLSRLRSPAFIDAAFATGLSIIAVYGFEQSFGGHEYLIAGVIGVACGVGMALLALRLDLAVITTTAASLLVFLVVAGVIAAPQDAALSMFPTWTTIQGTSRAAVTGWMELLTTVPPVGRSGYLFVLPFLAGQVAATSSVLLARRTRSVLAPLIPPAGVLALGLAFGFGAPVSVAVHGVAFVAAALCWSSARMQRRRGVSMEPRERLRTAVSGVALAAAATVVAMLVGSNAPWVSDDDRSTLREAVAPPFDPSRYPSPLAGYREFVKANKDVPLFRSSGLPSGVPVRLATMDDYDGNVWRVTGGASRVPTTEISLSAGYFERVGTRLDPPPGGRTVSLDFEVLSDFTSPWVPTVGELIAIEFGGPRAQELEQAFRYNRATGTAATQGLFLKKGDQYRLEAVVREGAPADGQIGIVGGSGIGENVPEALVDWAAPVVRTTPLPQRPKRLADELRSSGVYSSGDVANGQVPSLGGHTAIRLEQFISEDQPVGNAEQYAAALALMLRADNVATRVVTGFVPDEWDSLPIEFTGESAEAWVEYPVDGFGWVAEDATPDRENIEPEELPASRPQPERNTQVPPPPPVLADDPRSEPAAEGPGKDEAQPEEDPSTDGEGWSLPVVVVVAGAILLPPLVLMVGTALVIVVIKRRRRRRRRTRGAPLDRISGGWLEFIDVSRDFGRPVPSKATRREIAALTGVSGAPQLALRADTAVFAPGDVSEADVELYWSELEASLKSIGVGVSRLDRLKARLNLTSLRRRRQRTDRR